MAAAVKGKVLYFELKKFADDQRAVCLSRLAPDL